MDNLRERYDSDMDFTVSETEFKTMVLDDHNATLFSVLIVELRNAGGEPKEYADTICQEFEAIKNDLESRHNTGISKASSFQSLSKGID